METFKNLTEPEINLLVGIYNDCSGEGPVADSRNYQFIVPEFAVRILKHYRRNGNATCFGKTLADNILEKINTQNKEN